MKTLATFLFDSWLFESPLIDRDLDANGSNMIMHRLIKDSPVIETHGTMSVGKIGNGLIMYHGDKQSPRSSSLMIINDSIATHQYTHKGSGSIDEIHQNIDHMLNRGYEVHSGDRHSAGGRNLWMNIHSRFPDREIGVISNGRKTQHSNLESFRDNNDINTKFYIK